MEYNVYCDESCHLEHDSQKYMLLGAIRCNKKIRKSICKDIRNIKKRHNMNEFCEIKWTKISQKKIELYKEVITYFFDNPDIDFRVVMVDKSSLKHDKFCQTHDDFYYKLYYQLLSRIIVPLAINNIYIDKKDTKGARKVKKLAECLANGIYDFDMKYIRKVQNINSKESELLQLADILIGAVGYINRGEHLKNDASFAKKEIIDLITLKSGYNLTKSTFLSEEKFNIFIMELSNGTKV